MQWCKRARELWIWIGRILRWAFVRPVLAWCTLIVLCAAYGWALWWDPLSDGIRVAGMGLQLCGIGTVAWGIRETRKSFDRPGFISRFRLWIQAFPQWPRTHSLSARGVASSSALGNLTLTSSASAESLEDRVAQLETDLKELRAKFDSMAAETKSQLKEHSERMSREEQNREAGDKKLMKRLELTATGGLDLSFMGVVWLFVGVVMGTAPEELAQLASSLG